MMVLLLGSYYFSLAEDIIETKNIMLSDQDYILRNIGGFEQYPLIYNTLDTCLPILAQIIIH